MAEASDPRHATAKRTCSRRRRVHSGSSRCRRWADEQEPAAAEHLDDDAVRADDATGAHVPTFRTPRTTRGHTR